MTLPVMEPDLWERGAETLEEWSRAIDEGPFASLCFGERMAFDNPDATTLLGAVAAWTTAGPGADHRDRAAAAPAGAAGQGARHRRPAVPRAAQRGLRRGRPRGGLPRGVGRPRHPDDGRHGRAGRGDAPGLGRREGHRGDAPGRATAGAVGWARAAGRHDGTQDHPARRRLGGRAGRLHPRPGPGGRRRALRPGPGRLGRRRPAGAAARHVVLVRARRRRRVRSRPRCTATCGTT